MNIIQKKKTIMLQRMPPVESKFMEYLRLGQTVVCPVVW